MFNDFNAMRSVAGPQRDHLLGEPRLVVVGLAHDSLYPLNMEVSMATGVPKKDGFIREDSHLEMDDLGLPLF